jgi:zinc protease
MNLYCFKGCFPKTSVFGKATSDLIEKAGFRPLFRESHQKLTGFWVRLKAYMKKITVFLACVVLGGLVFSCGSAAKPVVYAGLGAASDPIPFMAKARTGTLPSGLRYYILENSKPENRAYLTLAVNAGSVLEEDNEQGLAHFTEHMAFNGTARFPEAELINYLRSLGMRFGPEVNAHTSFDETVYGIEVPTETGADGKKNIPAKALAIIDDWTRAITFAPADVDDERLVILEEYRTTQGAMERIRKKLLPVIFRGSPYANREPIGLKEIIETAPAERLEAFYKKWYRADNMALIFVGDFDGAALEKELTSYFLMPAPEGPLNRPRYDLPAPEKGALRVEIITDPELPFTRADFYYKRSPQVPQGDIASYREGLIDDLIDRMLSLRFGEAISKPETPYVGAWAGKVRYGYSSRYYILAAQAKTKIAEAVIEELLKEKESLSRYGFTDGEINRAKRSLLSDMERMVSEKDRQESFNYAWNFTYHFLAGKNVADVEWELGAVKKMLPGINAKDINAVITSYFDGDDLTIFLTAPEAERQTLPSQEKIRQLAAEARKLKIAPPQDAVLEDELIGEVPQPGNILVETEDPETGALEWELSNGAQVILKETHNQNNEIVFYALARGGTTSVGEEEYISASLTAEMLNASGLGPYTRPELIKNLADKQVSLSFWISNYTRGFQGAATAGDIKTLFEMLYLSFAAPRIDDAAVKAMMDQYRTALTQELEDPDTVFSHTITRTIYGNKTHFKPLELADLAKADLKTAVNFAHRALNPADYTFVFIGNLDKEVLRSLTQTYLASIPPKNETWNAWTDLNIARPGKTEQRVYKGKEERALVYQGWYTTAPYSESGAAAAAVLNEYLDIKLTEEIREALGGVYSIGSGVSLSPIPHSELDMGVYFICDPKRAAELSAAVTDQLARIASGVIDGDTFTKAVEAMKKNWEASIQSNIYIARNYANFRVLLDLPLGRLDKRPELYQAVTIADIQAAAAWLLPKGPAQVILYPEGWTNAP